MSRRPIAVVTIIQMPRLHPEAVRVEIECRYSITGLTSIPGPLFALSREQRITSATLGHEARRGQCDTRNAHEQGDQQTSRPWNELLIAAQRRYDQRSQK
jgi:hypothetical protein